jgi:hypothetical protein
MVNRDSHFERAVGEFWDDNALVASRLKGAKQVFDGLVKQERDESDKFKKGVQEVLAGFDSALSDRKNKLGKKKQDAVNTFTCSELSRRVRTICSTQTWLDRIVHLMCTNEEYLLLARLLPRTFLLYCKFHRAPSSR